jgi:hypothetical protein
MKKDTRDAALALFALFYFVFLVNIGSIGFVWDDWEMLYRAREAHTWAQMFKRMAFIEPRVQILFWSWWWGMAKVFGTWAAPYFAVILTAHFGASLLLYRCLRALDLGEVTARGSAALYLVVPSSAVGLFSVCNSLFIFPCAALVLVVWLALTPLENRWLDAAVLTLACLVCQFLNDATVPLLYFTLLCLLLREAVRASRPMPFWPPARLLIAIAACAGSLALYWLVLVRAIFPGAALSFRCDLAKLIAAAKTLLVGQAQALDAASWMFGKLSVLPSPGTFVLMPALILVLSFLILRAPSDAETPRAPAARLAGTLAAGFAAALAPLLWAFVVGIRGDMETRYLCIPGLVLAVIIAVGIDALSRLLPSPASARLRRGALFGAAVYLSFLMLYDLRDIWGLQKRVDEKVWAQLDFHFPPRQKYIWERPSNPRARYLITDGMQRSTLMPLLRSNALGSFSAAKFGVQGRMRLVNGADMTAVERPLGEVGGRVLVQPYYEAPRLVDKSELFSVVFRYGLGYSDLEQGVVLTFPNYDDYKRYRAAEGLKFQR